MLVGSSENTLYLIQDGVVTHKLVGDELIEGGIEIVRKEMADIAMMIVSRFAGGSKQVGLILNPILSDDEDGLVTPWVADISRELEEGEEIELLPDSELVKLKIKRH